MIPVFDSAVTTNQDIPNDLEKLRWQLAKCQQIVASATDAVQRDLFSKLAQHYQGRIMEIERGIRSQNERALEGFWF